MVQSGLVCGCMSLASVCKEKLVRHGVSEVTPCSSVFVCSRVLLQMGVVCCGFDVLWVRECVMECGCVSFCGCKVASCVCVYVGWVLLAVQVEICGW